MTTSQNVLGKVPPKVFHVANAVLSAGALAFLAWILVFRRHEGEASMDLRFMPAVNASLNALSATFLVTGVLAIKRGARDLHRFCMLAALTSSALFLVGYLAYHYVHGDTRFAGDGAAKVFYLVVLASHVLLSIFVVPLALAALYFALTGRFAQHRKVTRFAFPIWLYVSVTGVLIFFLLRSSLPAAV